MEFLGKTNTNNMFGNNNYLIDNINKSILDGISGPVIYITKPILTPTPAPAPTPAPTPISNICFPGNTIIKIDAGIIPIKNIDSNVHTINGNKIIAVTKTITLDNHLVCFKKNALGINYPSNETIVSKNHKIFYNQKFISAFKFVKNFENVSYVPYSGEILYNILMEKHSIINVNNMACETLHPNNFVAKLYTNSLSDEIKTKSINMCNQKLLDAYNLNKSQAKQNKRKVKMMIS